MANVMPPQFSLRTLMLLMAAAGVVFMLGTMPAWLANPIILLAIMIASMMLLVGIVWGDTWLRTFCIGAILPLGTLGITILVNSHVVVINTYISRSYFEHFSRLWPSELSLFRTHTAIVLAVSIALGLVATTTRRWIERHKVEPSSKSAPKRPPPPRPRRESTRIIFEFAGGPMDGKTVIGDAGDQGEAERYYLLTNRGQVGQRFSVASHYAVDLLSQDAPHDKPPVPRHVYEVTGQLDGDDEVLVRAEYVRRTAEAGE